MGRSGPVTCRCHPGSLCVRLQPCRVRAPWVGQGQQPGQRPPRGAERAARGGAGSGHVTSGPEALASETPGDRVVSSSVERARRSRGSLQLRVPRVHRHGLDQVPAVPGRAHARHRLHQHALGKVGRQLRGPGLWREQGTQLPASLPPALCDMTGTSIMYVALNMTSASSFQMLRGAVIIFTGLFSVAFLGRRLALSQWLGILVTIAGLVVVGLADLLSKHDDQHKLSEVITGDLLIIMAQIIISIQMVLEEKFVYKHNVHPLRAVGTEGLFGLVILSLLLVPMYYIPAGSFSGNPRGVLEDALDAFCQVGRQPLIALALLGNISSIAFFNFAGISVTKELSATTRMVLDSLRTVVIWALSLALGWEAFHPLQILGFLILLLGTALYNGLHRPLLTRLSRGRPPAEEGEHERLLGGSRTAINDAS
uniref:Solute carrier family 35 member F6 n=1 Tax=Equus caballus TaxID=9796 RepID=A0A5F5Q331_HORSE